MKNISRGIAASIIFTAILSTPLSAEQAGKSGSVEDLKNQGFVEADQPIEADKLTKILKRAQIRTFVLKEVKSLSSVSTESLVGAYDEKKPVDKYATLMALASRSKEGYTVFKKALASEDALEVSYALNAIAEASIKSAELTELILTLSNKKFTADHFASIPHLKASMANALVEALPRNNDPLRDEVKTHLGELIEQETDEVPLLAFIEASGVIEPSAKATTALMLKSDIESDIGNAALWALGKNRSFLKRTVKHEADGLAKAMVEAESSKVNWLLPRLVYRYDELPPKPMAREATESEKKEMMKAVANVHDSIVQLIPLEDIEKHSTQPFRVLLASQGYKEVAKRSGLTLTTLKRVFANFYMNQGDLTMLTNGRWGMVLFEQMVSRKPNNLVDLSVVVLRQDMKIWKVHSFLSGTVPVLGKEAPKAIVAKAKAALPVLWSMYPSDKEIVLAGKGDSVEAKG